MRYLLALIVAGALGLGCGSDGQTETTNRASDSTIGQEAELTSVGPTQSRSDIVGAVGSDRALAGLSDTELGCVVDELLLILELQVVVALISNGPTPAQAPVVVDALRSCDLVLVVAGLGLSGAWEDGSGTPSLDPDCILQGVTEDDMAPVLEALFAGANQQDAEGSVDALLSETPVMSNLVRCGLEDLISGTANEVPRFCRDFVDRVATMMATVVERGMVTDIDVVDPELLIELFGLSDEVFVWLAENVPDRYQADAEAVRDASARVSELMTEAFDGLDVSSDPEEVLAAMFGAVTRIDAELAADSFELESARVRLQSHVTSTCGDSAAGLFDILAGAGALTGV
ncbi:MAG: hypothetical protein VX833_05745 [Actinomycetota bacterium]|nr:hypothetical protein [Actinomycetota bacterium]